MIGTPAADMMCLDVLTKTQSKVKCAPQGVSFRFRFCVAFSGRQSETRLPLNAHVTDGGGRRSDEDDAFLFARLCKLCVLRQKAITGVHSLKMKKPENSEGE